MKSISQKITAQTAVHEVTTISGANTASNT
nr:MAG TPA: hypothetical protein [Caudoviricetes sp.]